MTVSFEITWSVEPERGLVRNGCMSSIFALFNERLNGAVHGEPGKVMGPARGGWAGNPGRGEVGGCNEVFKEVLLSYIVQSGSSAFVRPFLGSVPGS